jgi:uncharacterized protein (TIGR02246 family)
MMLARVGPKFRLRHTCREIGGGICTWISHYLLVVIHASEGEMFSAVRRSNQERIMNVKCRFHRPVALLGALLLLTFVTSVSAQPANAPAAQTGAVITIALPPDAEIFFDGAATTQRGSERRFVCPPLQVGKRYVYEIRARWTENGRSVQQTKKVSVRGGDRVRVDFLAPLSANNQTDGRIASYGAADAARLAAGGQSEGDPKDKAAIQKNGEAFVESFHKGDARALAAFWTPYGDYTDESGRHLKGREAIEKTFEQYFAANKGLKLRIESQSLRFVTPDVAVEDGITEVVSPNGGPPSRDRYSIVHVKQEGQWLLGSVHETAFTPPSNREHLQGLEWAIGDWTGEAGKGEAERLAVAWAENENFVIATFSRLSGDMPVAGATQWIGWDPLEKRLRSWIFDAAGGFGEGSWTQDGNKWVVKTNSVLHDGKKAAATFIITHVDADTLSLQARDRSVEGKTIPDTPEVKLKRLK